MPRTIHGLANALTSAAIPSDKSDVLIGVSNLDPTKNRSEKLSLDELEAIIKAEGTTDPLEIQKGNFDADAGSPALDFTTMRRGDSYNITVAGAYDFNDGEGTRYCPLDSTVVAGTSLVHIRRSGRFGFVPLSEVGFTFGWLTADATGAAQARANSELMETLKQRCWDDLTGHRISLRFAGVLRMDMAMDDVIWPAASRGTPITSGYGTVTYDAAAGTITRSAGSWVTDGFDGTADPSKGAIKVVDPTNPDNNEIHMIDSITVGDTVITVRSDGNDKDIQVSTTTTNATFTPLSDGERSALSLIGDHSASLILARYGKGHACISYGSDTNVWTSSWLPGGGAATSADTYFNDALYAHGVEFYSPAGGSGLVVQNGNAGNHHCIDSIRVTSLDANYAAFHGYRIFAGSFRNMQSRNTAGDGIYFESPCNTLEISMRVEGAGGRGCFIGGAGNTIHVDNETCKDWGLEISGSGNHVSGYVENNKYHTIPESWNPQIKVTGIGNVISGRLLVTTINTRGLVVYGSRDAVETTTIWQGTRQLDPSFDIRAAAKPWAGVSTGTPKRANRRGSAYFTLQDVADGPGTMNFAGITDGFWTSREDVELSINASARSFTRHTGLWSTNTWVVGEWIRVRRTAANDGLYLVSAVDTSAVDEVQSAATSTGTGGTFTLKIVLSNGEIIGPTAGIAFDAIYSVIETAIDTAEKGVSEWTDGDITVGGGGTKWDAGPTTFTFDGVSVAGTSPRLVEVDDTSLTGGSSGAVTRTTEANKAQTITVDARHANEFTTDEHNVQARIWKDIYVEVDSTVDFDSAAKTITKAAGTSWVDLGYVADGHILIRNAGLNDGIYEISSGTPPTATVITINETTLTTATTITCDHAPIGDDSVAWWEGDGKLRIKIAKTEMGTGLLSVKPFDKLDTDEVVQFIGLPIKSTDRAYYRMVYDVSDPDYYIDNIPAVANDDNYAIQMSHNTPIGFRGFAFAYGPGKHTDARWWDNSVGDVASTGTNAINFFLASTDHPSNANAQIITIHSFEYAISD